MSFFSDRSLFKVALDESLVLLFIPTCKIMFVSERFKCGFRKSFMSSIVSPGKILTLTEFGFVPDILFWLISSMMDSLTISVVSFAHWVGVVGGVLLLWCAEIRYLT